MKLEPDIVRQLLLDIEERHTRPDWEMSISNEDFPKFYSAKKLLEAGFLVADFVPDNEDPLVEYISISEMTIAGHEFLETVRDPRIWSEVKAGSKSIGAAGIETLLAIAKGLIKKKVEQHTGLQL
jgi:hypothetical protein